ncbi:MAG: MATE family efflux transporter [Lachnospiraceae bacterium]|nr:MATE family efflux transporter [Lachnospiraceae bacterium]
MIKQKPLDMKKGKSLIILSFPIFIELFLQLLVGNVDQFMVGRYSQSGVAAIGNANQIMNMIVIVFSVISISTTILVSLYNGAGDKKRVQTIYTLSIFVNSILSLVISLVVVLFARCIFTAMQVPSDVMEEAVSYISIIGMFIIFQGLYNTFTAIFRSNALMKESMVVSFSINLINIVGNALLIPKMGIAGAAISSNLSRFIGLIIMVVIFKKRVDGKISLSLLRPFPKSQLRTLLSIGLPSGGESLSYTGSQLIIQTFVNPFGTAVITAKAYSTMFAMVSYLYTNAISQASQIVVGHLMGARDSENVKRQVQRTLFISISASLVVSVTLFVFSQTLFALLTTNKTVIDLGQTILFIDIFLEIGRAVNMTMVRDLQTVGDIVFPIVLGIVSMWIISVFGGFILGIVLGMGLKGFWIAMAVDECFRGIVFIERWFSGRWQGKNIIDKN